MQDRQEPHFGPSHPDKSTSIGSGQDDGNATVRFTNASDLFLLIDRVPGDILTVTHVSPRDFIQIEREREIRRRKVRFRRYEAQSRILIVTIPTGVHERLHLVLYGRFDRQLQARGLDWEWMPHGSRTLRAAGGHPGGDGGEGDSTGGPSPEREGIGRWPTLVIEAGDSESLRQLEADMRWWFDKSNHDVKIVLLAKFDRKSSRIILQKWEEETPSARTGATTTRRPPPLQPVLRQEIIISRDQSTDPPTYNVARGELVLGFRLLFLRDPGLQDGDFVIGIEDLERYARAVWTYVD